MTRAAKDLAWELAEHLAPPARSASIVDLSAGRGGLLNALAELGYPVLGSESSSRLCQMARASYLLGPEVLVNQPPGDLLTMLEDSQTGTAAIALFNVVEVHPDPTALLRRCRDVAAGGLLFVGVPLVDRLADPAVRCLPTPWSLVHLAAELQLEINHLTVSRDLGLTAVFGCPAPAVVDLDSEPALPESFDSVLEAYRAMSPALDHFVPTDDDELDQGAIEAVGRRPIGH